MADPAQEIAETARLTARAAEVGRDDAFALSSSGFAIANILGDLDAGAALDRSGAGAQRRTTRWLWPQSGYVQGLARRARPGDRTCSSRPCGSSPVDSLMFMMQTAMAFAHFIAGRYDEAYAWAEKALQRNPFVSPAHANRGRECRPSRAIGRGGEISRPSAPARSRLGGFEPEGAGQSPPARRSRPPGRGPAQGGTAGMIGRRRAG